GPGPARARVERSFATEIAHGDGLGRVHAVGRRDLRGRCLPEPFQLRLQRGTRAYTVGAGSCALASPASSENARASSSARAARILRSTVTPAAFKPTTTRLNDRPD